MYTYKWRLWLARLDALTDPSCVSVISLSVAGELFLLAALRADTWRGTCDENTHTCTHFSPWKHAAREPISRQTVSIDCEVRRRQML